MAIIHSLFFNQRKHLTDKGLCDSIPIVLSLHKNYKTNSSGIGKFLTSKFLNTIDPIFQFEELGFLF
jgi:hypothetical protein